MKKHLLTLIICLAIKVSFSQTIDSIPHHFTGHTTQPVCITQMDDGQIIGVTMLYDSYYNTFTNVGNVMHKMSRHGGVINDTLLTSASSCGLPFSNPTGDGNLYAEMLCDVENNTFVFRMHRFDDEFNMDSVCELDLLLENGYRVPYDPGILLNPNKDLVLAYFDYYNHNLDTVSIRLVCMGLDGTVKHAKEFSRNEISMDPFTMHWGPKVFSESPLRYCIWGSNHNGEGESPEMVCYILDSLFNIEGSLTLDQYMNYPPSYSYCINTSWSENMLGFQNGDFLVAVNYSFGSLDENGTMLRKYDKDFNKIKELKFLAEPHLEYEMNGSRFTGLEHSRDGGVYFAYYTQSPFVYFNDYYGQLVVVKMDEDLNIIWRRYCLEPEGYGRNMGRMTVLDDNGVAIIGNYWTGGNGDKDIFFVIVNDDYDGVGEQNGVIIRPYTYWPNPVQSELHLEYSPDVSPILIELYDIQGRLLQSQSSGFHSFNMQGLPAGQYLMKVTLEDGKVFTNKVMKE